MTDDTPTPGAPSKTAILVAAFDSQLKWAGTIRQGLESRGFACQIVVPSDIRHAVSDGQLVDFCGDAIAYQPWSELISASLNVDVVVLAVQGPQVRRFCHDLFDAVELTGVSPPVTISGWVGVIIEKITAGYLERYATDIVAVNTRSDLAVFEAVARSLRLPTDNLLLCGLPLLSGTYREAPVDGPIKTVLFADQPTVPQAREDRLYIYQRLMAYAQAHPDRQVVLKPRHRIGEETFHRMRFHPEVLLSDTPKPPNFCIDYTPISERLAHLDLMLTISSTAALEAVGAGVRTAFIADLDVREQLGNHIFLDSGLLRTFDQLERDDIGVPAEAWIADYFFDTHGATPAQQMADRALELIQPPAHHPQAWHTALFASQHELITYRKQAAAGAPLMGYRTALLRGAARWILPYGVQLQLRRVRARRNTTARKAADETRLASAGLDTSVRHPSRSG
ncbi:MAG TPA: DUF6716 putative glycosyltransferase [Propionibacteriaceae bacterium]|nr:DUF6716 putative glycosyltransferase [Propionibacteriaceae bacterium]